MITFESGLLAPDLYPFILDGAVLGRTGRRLSLYQWNSSNPDDIASDGTITPDLFEDKEFSRLPAAVTTGETGESEEVEFSVKAFGVDSVDLEVHYSGCL